MADARSPLAQALDRVGDRWSLLIVDALMASPLRFGELSRSVAGIAPNVLSARLDRLENARVITSSPYSQRPLRFEYRLTAEGQELAGVLRLLSSWGQGADVAAGLRHEACGTQLEAQWYCPTCASVVAEEEGSELRRV
jgi:DNA-binding HxlR family transcriptional regulator